MINAAEVKKDKYYVTLIYVWETIITVEKQSVLHILSVGMCI